MEISLYRLIQYGYYGMLESPSRVLLLCSASAMTDTGSKSFYCALVSTLKTFDDPENIDHSSSIYTIMCIMAIMHIIAIILIYLIAFL
jgi:hypothetical protein